MFGIFPRSDVYDYDAVEQWVQSQIASLPEEEDFTFYEEAYLKIPHDDPDRMGIVIQYVWWIERLHVGSAPGYVQSYNAALLELIRILEPMVRNASTAYDQIYTETYISQLENGETGIVRNEIPGFSNDNNNAILLLAEIYRRLGIFEKTVEILEKYDNRMAGDNQIYCDGIKAQARKGNKELFYVEIYVEI